MSDTTTITAELREDVGKGASRRLRREGKVPAVIYGGERDAVALTLEQVELLHQADSESFFSSVLEIRVGKKLTQQAVVRDMHRHPYKPVIMHVDFMRVSAKEAIRISVPVHFDGEEESPAGRASGVVIQHQLTDIEISALPKDLPEFISVDLSELEPGEAIMLSEIELPEGVTIQALEGDAQDASVANAIYISEDQGTGAAAAAEAEAAAEDELAEAGVPTIDEDEEADESEEGPDDESESESKD
ncbi:MAG: 50S ribosomal protein L25/general stress protein Ctc [Gammaproteobacteria bacterium]|nr:50S ribosomal protein L25/general stress protein Ctc [Gammaproteobacteria bacterium]NNJ77623.1 50S ribosomal protein L25/general stress protein Ctc [Xanthomonadales bacterium]